MNNITANACTINFDYRNALRASYIAWYICGFLCTSFGIPGHLVQIYIMLNKKNRQNPISYYFAVIPMCELVFLIDVFWLWCLSMSITKVDPRSVLSCGIFYSLTIGPTILSNLYLASMSIDRVCMVLSPTGSRSIITRRHVLIRIAIIFIIVILLMIPHHFYFKYNNKTTIFICEFDTTTDAWKIRAWPFVHAILFVSLPSIVTCISATILLRNRCNHRKNNKNQISLNARRMERNSLLILFISIGMLFSVLPAVILEIFIVHDRIFPNQNPCSMKTIIYRILLNWFLTLSSINYSFKFYIRVCCSMTFQKDFLKLLNVESSRRTNTKEQRTVTFNQKNAECVDEM